MLEPTRQGESIILRFLTDDNGTVLTDIPCPIACGSCCDYWREVKALQPLSQAFPKKANCPNLRSKGCKLKRSHRPLECKIYLCELSTLAIENLISQEEIQLSLNLGNQNSAFSFFNRYPKTEDTTLDSLNFPPSIQEELNKAIK